MPVRTKRLFVGVLPTPGVNTIYTCPAGETTIVKSWSIYNAAAAAAAVEVRLVSGATVVNVYKNAALGAGLFEQVNSLWHVLLPGDVIQASSSNGNTRMWISGTELEGLAD